jgi:hypothetical protein
MPTTPACHDGLGYPAQVPLTTPELEGDPVAQPLGPPLPPTLVRKFAPALLLQNPDAP